MALLILATTGSVMDTVRDTADTFGWDPKLFFSQVISFIIVAYLLKRFAYKPILGVLEQRRQQIADAQLNAEKIKQQLAEAEQRHAEILAKANAQAQKMIDDARESASHVADRKRELGRLVVDTTAKVTGKVLTSDDQRRLQEEASRQLAS